ncbi:hypothetical protein B7463_g8746, partial [Scytalidium lignicola]
MPTSTKHRSSHQPSRAQRRYRSIDTPHHSEQHPEIIISQSYDKEKEADTESRVSEPPIALQTVAECPFQQIKAAILEPKNQNGSRGMCLLLRIKVWHAIPLCLLATVALLIASIILLVLATCRLVLVVGSGAADLVNSFRVQISAISSPRTRVADKTEQALDETT